MKAKERGLGAEGGVWTSLWLLPDFWMILSPTAAVKWLCDLGLIT